MATLTVESVDNNSAAGVFPKPASLAVDDFIVVAIYANRSGTFTTVPSGFTEIGPITMSGGDDATMSIFYKVADSGDVAASNFTFAHSNAAATEQGIIMRVTGTRTTSVVSDTFSGTGGIVTSHSFAVGIDPATTDCLLVSLVGAADADVFALSSVAYSPSTTLTNARLVSNSYSIDYAIQTDEVDITAVTFSTDVTARGGAVMLSIRPDHPTSGTTSLLEPATALFSEASVEVGGAGTHTLIEPTVTLNSNDGSGTAPTVWTKETRPSTTWTKEQRYDT